MGRRRVERIQTGAVSSQEPSELSDSRLLRKQKRERKLEEDSQLEIERQLEIDQQWSQHQQMVEEQVAADKAAGDRLLRVPALVRLCVAER